MSYFNYHAKATNLIKAGHLISAHIYKKYNHIAPALVLYFDVAKPMPIREYQWQTYFDLIKKWTKVEISHSE